MSPARAHRERFANTAKPAPAPSIDADREGGQPAPSTPAAFIPTMTPARAHRVAHIVAQAANSPSETHAAQLGADPAAAQIQLRLTHDLRSLKQMASIERRVDAKRLMIDAYREWCDAIMDASREAGIAEEVVPTMMVWSIDVGDWSRALELGTYVLEHQVPLPSRYQRSAPALLVEEIATAALKAQAAGEAFPLDVLEQVEALTVGADMHDEIRAKLMKAIGSEEQRLADLSTGADVRSYVSRAIASLTRAQQLNDRVGVKDRLKKLGKMFDALPPESETPAAASEEPATEPATEGAPTDTNTAGEAG